MSEQDQEIYECSERGAKRQKLSDQYQIVLSAYNGLYFCIRRFISELYIDQNKGNFIKLEFEDIDILDDDVANDNKVIYGFPENTPIEIQYKDHTLNCCINKISDEHGMSNRVGHASEMTIVSDSVSIVNDLILEACMSKKKQWIHHFNPKTGNWTRCNKIQNRDLSTLVLDEKVKNNIINSVNEFINSEQDYIKYGIPYKINYLFHGRPGTGKSTLASIIANMTQRSIFILSFGVEMTDSKFHEAVNNLDNKSILLLEDIDCIFHDRSTNANVSHVSFSALLNVLSGVSVNKSLITIITTNHVKKLDKALLRARAN